MGGAQRDGAFWSREASAGASALGKSWERICELETRGYSASTFAVCLLRAGDPMAVTTPWGHF